jgi:hypothetical protein
MKRTTTINPMKPTDIYASNYNLNAAAAQMSEHIDKLRQAGLIATNEAQDRIAAIEEVRALTSADVALNIVDSELTSARDAEQKRLAIQRKRETKTRPKKP